jgi:gamma-glutamylcyclotransferase (GGCT)/AIG2-like uncharacterized protein YtfP
MCLLVLHAFEPAATFPDTTFPDEPLSKMAAAEPSAQSASAAAAAAERRNVHAALSEEQQVTPPGLAPSAAAATDRIFYFAYGSNLDAERLRDRLENKGGFLGRRFPARLDNYRLDFSVPCAATTAWPGCGVGNVVSHEGSVVWGIVNEVDERSLEVLDEFEGVHVGKYARKQVSVFAQLEGSSAAPVLVPAVMYIGACELDPQRKPARAYLAHFIAGRDLLPVEYVRFLESIETVSDEALAATKDALQAVAIAKSTARVAEYLREDVRVVDEQRALEEYKRRVQQDEELLAEEARRCGAEGCELEQWEMDLMNVSE